MRRPTPRWPRPRSSWGPPSGAQLRCARGQRPVGFRQHAAGYQLLPAALTEYRPSDATWKQRLGLITQTPRRVMRREAWWVGTDFSYLPPNRNDIVVFRRFFFSFPSYTWQPWCAALAAHKCLHPHLFFARLISLGKLHKSPRSHTAQVRFR
jgi:hypothetical protein